MRWFGEMPLLQKRVSTDGVRHVVGAVVDAREPSASSSFSPVVFAGDRLPWGHYRIVVDATASAVPRWRALFDRKKPFVLHGRVELRYGWTGSHPQYQRVDGTRSLYTVLRPRTFRTSSSSYRVHSKPTFRHYGKRVYGQVCSTIVCDCCYSVCRTELWRKALRPPPRYVRINWFGHCFPVHNKIRVPRAAPGTEGVKGSEPPEIFPSIKCF